MLQTLARQKPSLRDQDLCVYVGVLIEMAVLCLMPSTGKSREMKAPWMKPQSIMRGRALGTHSGLVQVVGRVHCITK